MHKVYRVSNDTLKKDIALRKYLAARRFSLSVHVRQQRLDMRSDEIITSFLSGDLELKPSQYALFSRYIDVFGRGHKEELWDKLQDLADFDVRETAKYARRTWWQKAFNIDPDAVKYMPADKLNKKAQKFRDLRRKLNYKKDGAILYLKSEKIRDEARKYISAYLNGNVALQEEDAEAFRQYVKSVFYPVKEGTPAANALKKIENEDFSAAAVQEIEENTEKKRNWFDFKMPAADKLKRFGKAAAAVVLVAVSAVTLYSLTGKKTENKEVAKNNKTEVKVTKQTAVSTKTDKTVAMVAVQNAKEKKTAAKPQKQAPAVDSLAQAEHQALVNHHTHVIEMRLGKKKAEKLMSAVQSQLDNGVITLPDSIAMEEFAYALTMYRAYGVESSLANALNSKDKLTAEQNAEVANDIIAAGKTGLGVKKMAMEISKGKLNNESRYDNASKKSRQQHNMNLQQWRQAKKSRAA